MIKATLTNNIRLPYKGQYNQAMIKMISRLTYMLEKMVKKDKLSGQVLNRRTGDLSRSINSEFSDGGLTGTVGTNVPYGRVHEYGIQAEIKAHMRMMTQAFGKPVKEPRLIEVGAYTVKFKERSFLRTALRDLEPEIKSQLSRISDGVIVK